MSNVLTLSRVGDLDALTIDEFERFFTSCIVAAGLPDADDETVKRLAAKIEIIECGHDTPCWVWTGRRDEKGYGRFKWEGANRQAHGVTLRLAGRPVPAGLQADHLCRNRACCHPDHLEHVTNAENGRRGAGTKLTAGDVREIRAWADAVRRPGGRLPRGTRPAMAERYGVSVPAIKSVLSRQTWADIR